MAESVVSAVAGSLGDLLIEEVKFLYGVSEQVEQMQTELELMQTYLEDADRWQIQDKRVGVWVSKIREAAYDAEAAVETFALKIASRRRGGIQTAFKRYACIINEAAELHKVGSEIEAIKTRIATLTRCLDTYGIKNAKEGAGSSSDRGQQQLRQTYSHIVEEYTVGLDEDVKNLVEKLVNEEEQFDVVSICGMGGLGKTTLAKKVYHHNEIRRHFDAFAWAFISQQCQSRNVLEGILFELISPSKDQRDEILKYKDAELAKKLFEVQHEKKCLVIIDDIWTIGAWDSLRHAFPVGKAGSKILLTTRNKEVATHVDDRRIFLHEPRTLTKEEGWELFQKKAFPKNDDSDFKIDKDMDELGQQMVGRCGGLPLAIVVLGGILATKHKLDEWKMVHENFNSHLRRGQGHEQQIGVSEILALSYHELPYHLKPCFLYLGHFPEDFEISTKKLVRMWVAEGIVSPMQYDIERKETPEDIAKFYLIELLNRNMVQVGEMGSTGEVRTCRLHDLMRDLCLLKANEENFLKIVQNQDGNNPTTSRPLSSTATIAKSSHRIRRLAIYSSNNSWESERTPYLRSLLLFNLGDVGTTFSKMMFIDYKLIKILDLGEYEFHGEIPRGIGNLIHLRYLSIHWSPSEYWFGRLDVPSSFGNLRYLQTLILCCYNKSVTISNVIWKMERLRHLYLCLKVKKSKDKLRLDNLKDLQTLENVDGRMFDFKGLNESTNLKRLGIKDLRSIEELEGILSSSRVTLNRLCSLNFGAGSIPFQLEAMEIHHGVQLEESHLQTLLSSCRNLYKLRLEGLMIRKLPEHHHFPPNLIKLSLGYSKLEEDPMPTLEKLPNLSVLRLYLFSFMGKAMICSAKGFPQLKSLSLLSLPYLEEWHVGEEAMPNLNNLSIVECERLEMVPDGLRFITTLRELHITCMPVEFENRLKEGGEDFCKVQHVPSITIKRTWFDD